MHTIGIDFGTTKTLISYFNEKNQFPRTIKLGRNTQYIPTTAYIDENGRVFFGDEADDRIEEDTGIYIRGFKMRLGSSTPIYIYYDTNDNQHTYTAKDLVREYLRYIREKAQREAFMNEPVTKAVITRPVKFSPLQCEELKQAAQEAGFDEVKFTTEPEAAGLAFCRLNAAHAFRKNALVIDWGGGTLDIALVTRENDTISTNRQLTTGDTAVGGERFDSNLWEYAAARMKEKGITTVNPFTALSKIRTCKEQLSTVNEFTLRFSHAQGAVPPISITRNTFNELISDEIDRAVDKILNLLARIPQGIQPEILLLVGGSSRIPLIKQRLEEACGLPAFAWEYSREAVSLGAILWDKPISTPDINPNDNQKDIPTITQRIDSLIKGLINNHYELTDAQRAELHELAKPTKNRHNSLYFPAYNGNAAAQFLMGLHHADNYILNKEWGYTPTPEEESWTKMQHYYLAHYWYAKAIKGDFTPTYYLKGKLYHKQQIFLLASQMYTLATKNGIKEAKEANRALTIPVTLLIILFVVTAVITIPFLLICWFLEHLYQNKIALKQYNKRKQLLTE